MCFVEIGLEAQMTVPGLPKHELCELYSALKSNAALEPESSSCVETKRHP